MIERRSLASAAALAWLLASHLALAQRASKLPRVGYVSPTAPLADLTGPDPIDGIARAFVHGLRDLGWVDGRSVIIERRTADGRPERLPALLRELVDLPVDVIVTGGAAMARAARQATETIPIVAIGPDLVALGLASSLARPGGNVTGLPFDAGDGMGGKRLELLKRVVPAAKRITYIGRRRITGEPIVAAQTAAAARVFGLMLSSVAADRPEDLDAAFAVLARDRPDAIVVSNAPVNVGEHSRIIAFAARERLPAIYSLRMFADSGGLLSYGTHLPQVARRAALFVDKILKGAKPGDLPIDQPTHFELIVNLKAANALGVNVSASQLARAEEVIR